MAGRSQVRPVDRELDEALRRLGGTRLYRGNVFRLTGVPVTASGTVIRRRREEAVLMARLGTPVVTNGALPLVPPPEPDEVDDAFEAMRNPVLRLVHELLWLGDGTPEHDHAVRSHCAVIEGEPLTEPGRPDVDEDPLAQQWLAAAEAWARVLAGEEIWDRARRRVAEIDDPRLTTGTVRRLRERLPRHLVDVHVAFAADAAADLGQQAADRHLWVLDESSFDDDLVDAALREAARPAEDRIRAACEEADRVATTTPRAAIEAGHLLLERAERPLRTIAGLLGADDPVTTAAHDEVARAANLCAIAHSNKTGDRAPALDLLPGAAELARERTTIELIDRNLAVLDQSRVVSAVEDLCGAGKVNQAADRLRAWRRRTRDERLRAQIDEVLADPTVLRTPPAGVPVRGSFFGWGAYLWGRRPTSQPGMYVATHYLTVFFVPLVPMAAYLRDETYIYGKVPLSPAARWWRTVGLVLLVGYLVAPYLAIDGLLVLLVLMAGIAAALGWRRYRLDRWAAAQADG
ncbi:hypothetical protein [Amycolatopsis albispora]|uniref:Uncharacterized protein n=1 Tax=Amycolatopsis albispora TaxID=1804986 RepID=A0A344L0G9_9PSEU|nr:hypothetical protein [Amycolatopsis albispora]AXB41543.1 hypothetical protein A4R43_02585 [Amycolatopsis albispora]